MTNSKTKVDTEVAKRKEIDVYRIFIVISVLSVIIAFVELSGYVGEMNSSSVKLKDNQTILLKSGMFFMASVMMMLLAFGIRRKIFPLLWIFNILGLLLSISVIRFEKIGYDLVSPRIFSKLYAMPFVFVIGIIGTILYKRKLDE